MTPLDLQHINQLVWGGVNGPNVDVNVNQCFDLQVTTVESEVKPHKKQSLLISPLTLTS